VRSSERWKSKKRIESSGDDFEFIPEREALNWAEAEREESDTWGGALGLEFSERRGKMNIRGGIPQPTSLLPLEISHLGPTASLILIRPLLKESKISSIDHPYRLAI
jgi:hypothetical protein